MRGKPSKAAGDSRYKSILASVKPERVLRVKRVKPRTIILYSDHIDSFRHWAASCKLSIKSERACDVAMSRYFNMLFEDGLAMNVASYTLFGWICFKMCPDKPERDLLPLARSALTAWCGLRPGAARVGVPPEVVYHFLDFCMRYDHVQAAVAALLQYDLYARPSEILCLKGRDLVPPVPSLNSHWGVMFGNSEFAEQTKTGAFDDVVLADTPHRPWANKLLQHVSKGTLHRDVPLFSLTLAQYETVFRVFSERYRLAAGIFTPHVLRHSGPSYDAIHGLRSLDQIQARGRWTCAVSVARYKKPGRLLMQASKLPKVFKPRNRENFSSLLTQIFSFPWVPPAPASH